jgi:hypothetical protein
MVTEESHLFLFLSVSQKELLPSMTPFFYFYVLFLEKKNIFLMLLDSIDIKNEF